MIFIFYFYNIAEHTDIEIIFLNSAFEHFISKRKLILMEICHYSTSSIHFSPPLSRFTAILSLLYHICIMVVVSCRYRFLYVVRERDVAPW